MKHIIKITIWFYEKLGYTITITKGLSKSNNNPSDKLQVYTNGNVGV